jgi:hypothetical protein
MKNKKQEHYRAGLPRRLILDYLLKNENEWKCIEIPPDNKSKIRTIKFTRKENINE